MNQAIQFPDREEWNEDIKAICFPAMVNGLMMMCAISGESLLRRFGDGQPAHVSFSLHRWDLEEEAEQLIKEGSEDDQGWFWLS
ncbi:MULTISPECIES: DUF1488 domain-containing protein [unclassified Erwinia]|uniref:DUF1488 domain-containing protein n=1 Tax=unclassified Erwinia TaxID=2622719 RepID=UPI0008295EEA|nr:DUF1488 domain-containing protein [Erwinia sp. ErVv1]